jgi:hypothetical protein
MSGMMRFLATLLFLLAFSASVHPQRAESAHTFFDEAVASAYHWRSWSLRDAAQIEAHLYRKDSTPRHTSYVWPKDPFTYAQDGAKIVLPANVANYEQMRFPIEIGAHRLGVEKVSALVSWEFWADESWVTELNPKPDRPNPRISYKSFQLASYGRNPQIWLEARHRFFGHDGNLSYLDVRSYGAPDSSNGTVRGGSGVEFRDAAGKIVRRYGSDSLGPMLAEFPVAARTWTRFFAHVEFNAGDPYATVSYWVADETREPVAILRDRRILNFAPGTQTDPRGMLDSFWVEFNHSLGRMGEEMTGYVRNIVVLKDVPDVARWLRRPVGTGAPGRAGASRLSAPRGLRVRP